MALLPLLLMGSLIILRFLCCLRSTNKERLKPEDSYRSKPEIAAGMMRDLKAMGFRFSLVLADSLYGESGSGFVNVLYELKLDFAVAIRSNHAGCRANKRFGIIDGENLSVFSDGKKNFATSEKLFFVSVALSNSGS